MGKVMHVHTVGVQKGKVGVTLQRTMLNASWPKSRSPFFQATEERIFRFESLLRRTSKGMPGFMREAFM